MNLLVTENSEDYYCFLTDTTPFTNTDEFWFNSLINCVTAELSF